MSTTTRAALTALCATALTATLAASPTQAANDDYVALGDSFSAGTGTRASVDDCYRSPYGYPALLAGGQGLTLDYQACSGATTADVHASQLGTLSPQTAYVTMTIGGNDIGFADVITECALPGWLSSCGRHIDQARSIMHHQLPQRLDTLYGEIRDRAPSAHVVVAGYPYLFMGKDCNLATFFSRSEQAELNQGTAELDGLISDRVAEIGFTYVDVRDEFLGHAVCDDPEWINGLSWPIVESYHPNREGNVGYADALAPALTGQGARGPAMQTLGMEPLSAAGTGAGALGAAPGTDAAAEDAGMSLREQADAVLAMGLDTPANLRKADLHGVDRGKVTRAVAKLRSKNLSVVERGLVELHALDDELEARRAGV